MRKIVSVVAAASLASWGIVPASAAEFTVGIVQSLTGPAASVGVPVRDGALLAAEQLNKAEFLGPGNTIKVVVEDDAGDRPQVVTVMNRFAANPDILAVMGPTSGSVALTGLAVSQEKKLPAMTITNSMDALALGEWTFILTQPASVTVPYLARYAVETLKVKNCAAVGLNDNPASMALQKAFVDYITEHGAKMVRQEGIRLADTDFSAIATSIASMDNIDCVFIGSFAPQGANIIRQLREAGLKSSVRILGHNALASPDLITTGGAAVEGFYAMADWVPGGDSDDGRAFAAAFKEKYGAEPDNWGAMGYGGMRVIATAIKNAGAKPTRETVRDAIAKTRDVPVVTGEGRYNIGPDRIPRIGMSVLQVKDGRFVLAPK